MPSARLKSLEKLDVQVYHVTFCGFTAFRKNSQLFNMKTDLILRLIAVIALLGLSACNGSNDSDKPDDLGPPIRISEDGKSDFQIVLPEKATPVDQYAARQLEQYLGLITGATFPIVAPQEYDSKRPSIFLGSSAPVISHLGKDPVPELDEQEHVARGLKGNVFLYGKGPHGNLYAAVDFLEENCGWRWFSTFEAPVFPKQATLILEPFERDKKVSYTTRSVDIQRGLDFPYLHGANERFDSTRKKRGEDASSYPYSSESPESGSLVGHHSFFAFIPPSPDHPSANTFKWLKKSDYFKSNPEFFTMNESGVRVPNLQLNFGNPELRREFTKNVLEFIKRDGDEITVYIGAMDNAGRLCNSEESLALEKKYQTNSGPLIDYLIELCAVLQEKYPKVKVLTLAYRKEQTQRPPTLPPGTKLPENLIIEFAPIADNYFADWTHPDEDIQETYNDLKEWGKITADGNLRAWIYPNPYGSGYGMPVGMIERLVNNIRLMYKAGVRGLFVDQIGLHGRVGTSELQIYLILKLMMDVTSDVEKLTAEFTDAMYGKAAPIFRKYLKEIEEGRKSMKQLPAGISYTSPNLDAKTFPYLTVKNIHRWQGYFDRMEKLTEGGPENQATNVRLARREVDFATLWKWRELQKEFPEYYTDYLIPTNRIKWANSARPEPLPKWFTYDVNREWHTNPVRTGLLEDLSTSASLAKFQEKPYPEQFSKIPPSRIRAYLPNRWGGADETSHFVLDPDAATGRAVVTDGNSLPVGIGFAQVDSKLMGPTLKINLDKMVPGKYTLFDLGEISVTANSNIWLSPSNQTRLEVGERIYEPGAANRWHAYVSMKFEGPLYGGSEKEDRVLVDRIYLVELGPRQFEPAHE